MHTDWACVSVHDVFCLPWYFFLVRYLKVWITELYNVEEVTVCSPLAAIFNPPVILNQPFKPQKYSAMVDLAA